MAEELSSVQITVANNQTTAIYKRPPSSGQLLQADTIIIPVTYKHNPKLTLTSMQIALFQKISIPALPHKGF